MYFYRPKKCGGVSKLTNMRYDSKQVQFSNRILNGSTSVNIPGENKKLKFKTVDYEYIHCRIDVMDIVTI